MMGFNLPIGQYTPEMLVEMAKSGFRPPNAVGMGGMAQSTPGFNMGQGMAGLGGLAQGIGGLMGKGDIFDAKGRTAGDADLGGYGASPMDPMGGNPNAIPSEIFNPTGASSGGFGDWWRRNIGGLF